MSSFVLYNCTILLENLLHLRDMERLVLVCECFVSIYTLPFNFSTRWRLKYVLECINFMFKRSVHKWSTASSKGISCSLIWDTIVEREYYYGICKYSSRGKLWDLWKQYNYESLLCWCSGQNVSCDFYEIA